MVAISLDPATDGRAPTGQAFKGDMAVDSTGVPGSASPTAHPGRGSSTSRSGSRTLQRAGQRSQPRSSTPIVNDGALSVRTTNADYGVYGSGKSVGVTGEAPSVGVLGIGATGGRFRGSDAAIRLDPQPTAGAPTGQAFKGDMAVDSTGGVLWLCVADGTPGTWVKPPTEARATWVRRYAPTTAAPAARGSCGLAQETRRPHA